MTSRYRDVEASSATALPPMPALLTSVSTRPASSRIREAVTHRVVVGDVNFDQLDLDTGLLGHRQQLVQP